MCYINIIVAVREGGKRRLSRAFIYHRLGISSYERCQKQKYNHPARQFIVVYLPEAEEITWNANNYCSATTYTYRIQDEQPHFPESTKLQETGKRGDPLCITLVCIRRSGLQSSSPGWRHINFPLGPENI